MSDELAAKDDEIAWLKQELQAARVTLREIKNMKWGSSSREMTATLLQIQHAAQVALLRKAER